jgi:MFS superfamily sulfate permease-like transporter
VVVPLPEEVEVLAFVVFFVVFLVTVLVDVVEVVGVGVGVAVVSEVLEEVPGLRAIVSAVADAAGRPSFAVATRTPIPASPTKVLVALLTRQTPLRESGWLGCQLSLAISQRRESKDQGRKCKRLTPK